MIFVSENGITDASRLAAWDEWYLGHLSVMTTVDGIDTAQRFKTTMAGFPPSFAMYTVVAPEVFRDPYYLSIRGLGEFEGVRDVRWARRSLFSGLDVAPEAKPQDRLLVIDRPAPVEVPGVKVTWLQTAGLGDTTPWRGIAIVDAATAERAAREPGIALYVPVTGVYRDGKGAPY